MLKGLLKVIDKKQMQQLHEGTMNVLEKTGLRIRGDFLLRALADAGCRIDFEKERAWFKPDLVERQIAAQRDRYKMVRSSLWYPFCQEMPKDDVAWPDEFCVDFGYGTPQIYDYKVGGCRDANSKDQVDMIKLGNALDAVKSVCSPVICSDFDPKVEIIESTKLLLLNTTKPGWVGTSSGKEVKYLAEFAALAANNNEEILRTHPSIFVHAYCTTSPLKIDTRSCEVLEEAIKYGFPINFAPMPILGATTPVTPAGSVIVAAAEILGGITAASLIAPDLYYYATSISSEMDMKTTQIRYSTPAAILTDATLHQLFRELYGIVLNVEPAYVEAKSPGIQAAFMKTYRQMCFGCTTSLSLPIGILDNGSVFSPAQAMIDLEASDAMYRFAKGIEVNEDAMCIDLINELEFCDHGTYLESEHTLKHFRNVLWDAKYLNGNCSNPGEHIDENVLREADQVWRDLVDHQKSPEIAPDFRAEVERITAAANEDLLS